MLSFQSNDNKIEWKLVVIDRIMYYKENIIFRIILLRKIKLDNLYYIKLKGGSKM